MFGGMGRFFMEQKTFIVIVIGLIVICFLYWWLFHKGVASSNRVVGCGKPGYDKLNYVKNKGCRWCVGATIAPVVIGKENFPLFVLNGKGFSELSRMVETQSDFHLVPHLLFCAVSYKIEGSVSKGSITIKPLIRDPIKLFAQGLSRDKLNYGEGFKDAKFDFSKVFEEYETVGKDVLGCYGKLVKNVVMNYKDCFDFVDYVGQRADKKYKRGRAGVGEKADLEISEKRNGGFIENPNMKDIFDNYVNNKKDIRVWYEADGVVERFMVNHCFVDNDTGFIIDKVKDERFYNIYRTLVDYVIESIKKYDYEWGVNREIGNKIDFINVWIKEYEGKGVDEIGTGHRDLVETIKGFGDSIYSKNTENLEKMLRGVVSINVMYETMVLSTERDSLVRKVIEEMKKNEKIGVVERNMGGFIEKCVDDTYYIFDYNKRKRVAEIKNRTESLGSVDVLTLPNITRDLCKNLIGKIVVMISAENEEWKKGGKSGGRWENGKFKRVRERIYRGVDEYLKEVMGKKDSSMKAESKFPELKYQNADIYPAFKLSSTILFLMLVYSNCSKDYPRDDYMKMIASYVLFVNAFNTFCGVKMESSWNESIGNEYVYIKNTNVQGVKNMELSKEKIADLGVRLMYDYVKVLGEKHSDVPILRKSSQALERVVGESELFVIVESIIDSVCEICDFDMEGTEKEWAHVREMKKIGEIRKGMEDRGEVNRKYEAYCVLEFYLRERARRFLDDREVSEQALREMLDKFEHFNLQVPQQVQKGNNGGIGRATQSGDVIVGVKPFMHQFDTTCAECALYHAIYDIDPNGRTTNDRQGESVDFDGLWLWIKKRIGKETLSEKKRMKGDPSLDGFLGLYGNARSIFIVELLESANRDDGAHYITLKTTGNKKELEIYDSRREGPEKYNSNDNSSPDYVINSYLELSPAVITALRNSFKGNDVVIDYNEIKEDLEVFLQESGTQKIIGEKEEVRQEGNREDIEREGEENECNGARAVNTRITNEILNNEVKEKQQGRVEPDMKKVALKIIGEYESEDVKKLAILLLNAIENK